MFNCCVFDTFSSKRDGSYFIPVYFMLQRPENYLGSLETWEKAEAALAEALNEFGKPWQVYVSFITFFLLICFFLSRLHAPGSYSFPG